MTSPPDPHQSPQPSDRQIGLVLGAFLLIVSLLHGYRELRTGSVNVLSGLLMTSAAVLCAVAVFRPAWLAPVNKVWMALARILHAIASPIVLGAVFFLVLTPMAIVRRRKSRETFPLARDPAAASYWIPRKPPGPDPKTLNRQY